MVMFRFGLQIGGRKFGSKFENRPAAVRQWFRFLVVIPNVFRLETHSSLHNRLSPLRMSNAFTSLLWTASRCQGISRLHLSVRPAVRHHSSTLFDSGDCPHAIPEHATQRPRSNQLSNPHCRLSSPGNQYASYLRVGWGNHRHA